MRQGAAKVMAAGVNKDHLERLHSRVDQQSTLIEMLKKICSLATSIIIIIILLLWLKDQRKTVVYSTTSKEIGHTS